MSWANIKLSEISTTVELLPEKTFTLELTPGAKLNDFGGIQAAGRVVDSDEFNGRLVFFSYPDPESLSKEGKLQSWSSVAFKRLVQALGVDMEGDDEDKVAYLNRAAGNRFVGTIKHGKVTDEYPVPRANLQLLNVRPAA